MSSLGILQSSLLLQESHHYLNEIALYCTNNGISVYRFTPFSLSKKTEKIAGLKYDHNKNKWVDCSFPLPKYIYDRFFYPKSRHYHQAIYRRIQYLKEKSTFLGLGLPNKWAVYNWLNQHPGLKKHLPPTKLLSEETLAYCFKKEKQVILKPVFGSGGKGIYIITKQGNQFSIRDGKNRQQHLVIGDDKRLYDFLVKQLISSDYLLQPLLPLQWKGHPFDLRIVVQKQNVTTWKVIGKGFRIGNAGTFISNIQAGGKIAPSLKLPPSAMANIKNELEKIISIIPTHLEKYHAPLFELGIDIGIDESGHIWILEVNSKPGYETVNNTSKGKSRNDLFTGPGKLITNLENKQ